MRNRDKHTFQADCTDAALSTSSTLLTVSGRVANSMLASDDKQAISSTEMSRVRAAATCGSSYHRLHRRR
jgi:hypothetical protein